MDVLKGQSLRCLNSKDFTFFCPRLADRFLQPGFDGPLANKKFILSLRRLHLADPFSHENEWIFIIACSTSSIKLPAAAGFHPRSRSMGDLGTSVKMCWRK